LKDCVRSAAALVSSASIAQTGENVPETLEDGSELGDWPLSESSGLAHQWVVSNFGIMEEPEYSSAAGPSPAGPQSEVVKSPPSKPTPPGRHSSWRQNAPTNPTTPSHAASVSVASVDEDRAQSPQPTDAVADLTKNETKSDKTKSSPANKQQDISMDLLKDKPTGRKTSLTSLFPSWRRRREKAVASKSQVKDSQQSNTNLVYEDGWLRLKLVFVGEGAVGKTCFLK
jgi:hypothetical protein